MLRDIYLVVVLGRLSVIYVAGNFVDVWLKFETHEIEPKSMSR